MIVYSLFEVDGFSVYETASNSTDSIQDRSDVPEHRGINLPHIQLPHIELPPLDEILRGIREALEQAKTQLDRVIQDELSQAEEVLKNIERFVLIQIQLLPEGIQNAIQEFNKFRHEHPYIIAAASVALVILSTEVILPWMSLRVLGMFGFGELGPVAGTYCLGSNIADLKVHLFRNLGYCYAICCVWRSYWWYLLYPTAHRNDRQTFLACQSVSRSCGYRCRNCHCVVERAG